MPRLIVPLALVFLCSCHAPSVTEPQLQTTAKDEIALAEKAFEKMAVDKGVSEAFWYYADSGAVIKRQNDTLIKGKENIRNYYNDEFYKTATVTWAPDFIDASPDGNMGYTYGKYNWQFRDSLGKITVYKGVFHTVWKRQSDGTWKYVWD